VTKTSFAILAILALAALAMSFFWANRPRKVVIDVPIPENFPQKEFSHESFEELLQIYVTADGRVDYERWYRFPDSVQQLNSYLSAVSQFSPNNAPHRFRDRNDELAYWIYGYNAYVIKSVLDHWPLESVTDVKAPLEAVKGLGFFYQLRFSFGGEFFSLLSVETNQIRKRYKDPRIHFVLNCASESCPVARPGLPVGDDLEQLLAEATREFINDPDNVEVDHTSKVVHLSKIFKWYKDDFVSDVRLRGESTEKGLLAYVARYAVDDLADDISKTQGYETRFHDYDWGLNSSH
jgi:hypothetical protein